MVAINQHWQGHREEQIAQLTDTAYRAILACGYRGSFIELELSLWNAVRKAVEDAPAQSTVEAA